MQGSCGSKPRPTAWWTACNGSAPRRAQPSIAYVHSREPARPSMRYLLLLPGFLALSATAQIATLDPSFNPGDIGYGEGDGADGATLAVALQADGRIIYGGPFERVNHRPQHNLVRVFADGRLDTNYVDPSAFNDRVSTLNLQPDGKLICGGDFTQFGTPVNRLVRLNEDGTRDESFDTGTGFNDEVRCSALLPDGRILVGGDFTSFNGTLVSRIARLHADGSLDTSFNTGSGADNTVWALTLQADGKVLVGGNFETMNGLNYGKLVRLDTTGAVDESFDTDGEINSGMVLSVAVDPDGRVLAGGSFHEYGGVESNALVRLTSDGDLDDTFPVDAGFTFGFYGPRSLLVQEDGKILVGGHFDSYQGTAVSNLTRLNPDASIDTAYPTGRRLMNVGPFQLLPQADGRVLVAGGFTTDGNTWRGGMARINADGTLDASFAHGYGIHGMEYNHTTAVSSMAVRPDGRIMIAGDFYAYNDSLRSHVVRLHADGTLDLSFHPIYYPNNVANAMALQADGKVLLGGDWNLWGDDWVGRMVRLHTDGSRDTSFYTGYNGFNDAVYAIAMQPDGKILVGGEFTYYDDVPHAGLVRLLPDGTPDPTFVTGAGFDGFDHPVRDLLVQPDGKILACGDFTTYDGEPAGKLIRLNSDGSRDAAFVPDSVDLDNTHFRCLALQADGCVLVGGDFASYGDVACDGLIRLNSDGSLDLSFAHGDNAGVWNGGEVADIALQADGRVLASGSFTWFEDGVARNRIMRLESDGTLDTSFDPGGGFNGTAYCMALLPAEQEQVLVGGEFTLYQDSGCNRIMRMDLGVSTATAEPAAPPGLQAWPNPARESISFSEAITGHLLDAQGRVVRNLRGERQMDLRGLVPGNYLLRTADSRILPIVRE